jgi:ketosteroid isomerase-like protein
MKTKPIIERCFYVFAIVGILVVSCTEAPRDVKMEIEKINETFMSAISSQDVEAIVALHTSDAVVLPQNHHEVKGTEAIRQMWQGAFKHGMGSLKFVTSEAIANGNTAYESGNYEYFEKGIEKAMDHGKYMVVWKKEGSDWKISHDIWNSSMPRIPRATDKDTIAMAITTLKSEAVDPMVDFANEVFMPAFTKHFSDAKATARLFKVVDKKAKEGKLVYFIDPYKQHHTHSVKAILEKHYPEDKAVEHLKKFKSMIEKQEVIYAVPVPW